MRTVATRLPPSGPPLDVQIPETSSDIQNASTVAGATVTEALNTLGALPKFGPSKVKTVTIPTILDGQSSNVSAFTDADYIDCIGVICVPAGSSAPPDNLSAPLAWVATASVGLVLIKFFAIGGDVIGTTSDYLFIGVFL